MRAPVWLLLASFTGIAHIVYNFLSRKFLKVNGGPIIFSWWFSLIRTIVFVFPGISFFIASDLNLHTLLLLLLLGLINALNVYLFMRMHTLTELSLSSVIVQLRIVWVPLIALFLVHEYLRPIEYVGITLLFIAVFTIRSAKRLIVDSSVNTALAFSVSTSLLTVLLKILSGQVSTEAIIFAMSAPAVFVLPMFIKNKQNLFVAWKKDLGPRALVTTISVLNLYLFIGALALGGPVSKVNAIVQILSVFAGATGIIFLKEHNEIAKKVVALSLAVLGVFLIV